MNRTYHVYRNLNNNCWSVRHKGRVIAHMARLIVHDCEFRVNEKGRQRVIREGRKNVHAYIAGSRYTELELHVPVLDQMTRLTYNPYSTSQFVYAETIQPIYHTNAVLCDVNGKIYELTSKGDDNG